MARLLLGPLLRYVGENEATVWVETDGPCEVTVLGRTARTFGVEGHHYALVMIDGLEPGASYPYTVALDGREVWPDPESRFPPSSIRTIRRGDPLTLIMGSCRLSLPHEPPYSLTKDEDPRGRELDALYAFALRMAREPAERWPHLLLLCGDQVYADEVSPGALDFIRRRRGTEEPPGEQVADFEEYTRLYWDSWADPSVRWLMSCVSTAMIFDDHDVHDDWNISHEWVADARALPWWNHRIVGAFMSYWVYQHVGNLSPRELREDTLWQRVTACEDAGPLLRRFSYEADRTTDGSRWSYCRDLGDAKLVVVDSRAGRVLSPERRCMVDDEEWAWIEEEARGGYDHLLIGTTLPLLLGRGAHHFEAWSEAVCRGAWGGLAQRVGEKIRRAFDFEHWAAFEESFGKMTTLLREVASGERGEPPASIVVLSGDVHHAYLAEVAFRRGTPVKSRVWQAVCSPLRNPLDANEQRVIRAGISRAAERVGGAMARAAGVRPPDVHWRFVEGPSFDNQVATVALDGRKASLRVERSVPGEDGPELETLFARPLADGAA